MTRAPQPLQFLRLESEAGWLRLTYPIHQPMALGYAKRERMLARAVALRLRRSAPAETGKTADALWALYAKTAAEDVRGLAVEIERRLQDLVREPLPSVAVQEILRVTKAEVLRWNKEGRLKSAGTTQFMAGKQLIQTRTYGPWTIRRLLDDPSIIADWRARDAAA